MLRLQCGKNPEGEGDTNCADNNKYKKKKRQQKYPGPGYTKTKSKKKRNQDGKRKPNESVGLRRGFMRVCPFLADEVKAGKGVPSGSESSCERAMNMG